MPLSCAIYNNNPYFGHNWRLTGTFWASLKSWSMHLHSLKGKNTHSQPKTSGTWEMKENNHLQIMRSTGTHFSRFGIAPEKQLNKNMRTQNIQNEPRRQTKSFPIHKWSEGENRKLKGVTHTSVLSCAGRTARYREDKTKHGKTKDTALSLLMFTEVEFSCQTCLHQCDFLSYGSKRQKL